MLLQSSLKDLIADQGAIGPLFIEGQIWLSDLSRWP